ncbi:MAG: LLM class flavin-dependent oxidoreductase [Xanthobacteraceae bacterium]
MKLSLVSLGSEPGPRFLEQVKLAELLGFHAYLHAEEKAVRDPFARLGAATQVTTRLGIGVDATDASGHETLIARAAASLEELAPGRVRVVLAAGSRSQGNSNGPPAEAIRALHGTAELMRAVWRGEAVAGREQPNRPLREEKGTNDASKLYLCGGAPELLELAGRIADGVLIETFARPAAVEDAKRHIQTGLQAAGRKWNDIRLCAVVPLQLSEQQDEAMPEEIREGACMAAWNMRKTLSELMDALTPSASYEFKGFIRQARELWSLPPLETLRRLLPAGLLESFAVTGTGAQVTARLQELAAADIDEVVIRAMLSPGESMIDFMYRLARDVLPQFRERGSSSSV